MRPSKITIRVTPEELATLQALAERMGINASDVVRMLVHREHSNTTPQTKPAKRKPRQR